MHNLHPEKLKNMDSISIIIFDPTDLDTVEFGKKLSDALKVKVILDRSNFKSLDSFDAAKSVIYDVALIGEKVSETKGIQITKYLRSQKFRMPIIHLTNIAEASLTHPQQNAGADDILNITEIDSPIFSWTFNSILKKADVTKKAEEFDLILQSFVEINKCLADITHEINNPLGIIRLALFQLQSKDITDEKKAQYLQVVNDSIGKIEDQIKSLRLIREKMKSEQSILRKVSANKIYR
ncbi:MAG: hypothetical protein KJ963_06305 [Bacteroidetes bacterium]|nr:hypothetical protein [Bacteroidota bacterium]MBU1421646.1 hypothetical protein [Bacteroidota bacterium]MBU2636681.1 hypothetical protein [Bacteroidota bacterium]